MPKQTTEFQEHTSTTTTETGQPVSGAAARETTIRQEGGLKRMQENAYAQGYKDGFQDGREFGQEEAYRAISEQMNRIEVLLKAQQSSPPSHTNKG